MLLWFIGKRILNTSNQLYLKAASIFISLAIANSILGMLSGQGIRGNTILMLLLGACLIAYQNKEVALVSFILQAFSVLILGIGMQINNISNEIMWAELFIRIASAYFLIEGLWILKSSKNKTSKEDIQSSQE